MLWLEGLFRHFDNRRQVASYAGLRRRPGKADRSTASKAFPKQAIPACEPSSSSSPGYGCAISRNRRWPSGLKRRVRRDGGRLKKTIIVALARKVLVALMAGSREDVETVRAFFQDLRARGLADPLLVVSGAPGIIRAIEERLSALGAPPSAA